ncbi:hypothetical protein HHK36_019723 [Tetracentron sinense]|uniref:Uncharacterized protein n=1 Tax=Tetracentron sinense TaxID=13715 RepID=A0A834YWX0_TETSI|nr:hypothetical protein HHK36_019723 [Tetracentron sinense]
MPYHENVIQWNDSASEEAFHNAKNRFWAAINGLQCGISLPDPDIYIYELTGTPSSTRRLYHIITFIGPGNEGSTGQWVSVITPLESTGLICIVNYSGFLKLTVLELFKRKLTERKKSVSYHENVVHWNDSAGEEALLNARKRFWLQINDLPYDMFLPDPDIYIDEVDWNSEIDPQLLLDLDKITSGS